jgi:Right handed beta helix region
MSHGAYIGAATRTGIVDKIGRLTAMGLVAAAVATVLPAPPSYAADSFAFVSATGSGTSCTATQPCDTLIKGYSAAVNGGGVVARVLCLTPVPNSPNSASIVNDNVAFEVNCPLGYASSYEIQGANTSVTLRGLTFPDSPFAGAIQYSGNGTLIIEDCAFVDEAGLALDIEPNGPLTLVIRRSRISNNGSGMLLKPGAGGSIKATFDHVVITGNHGGGIKSDSTNGVINLDISNSEISNNSGNGLNAVSGANQNIVSIATSVIARNAAAGVQANGVNSGVLVATTLLDQNVAGATSVVGGGNMFTYGNNDIVGSIGSGFTGPAQPH